uniref:Uncharacterized protein n=1 Tax=Cyanothece sp. (strain PCC 7425 / ATCC 29141) TaxID=395961 RepID=B8HUI4_CYAP4
MVSSLLLFLSGQVLATTILLTGLASLTQRQSQTSKVVPCKIVVTKLQRGQRQR